MKSTNCPFRHVRGDKTIVCKHWLRGLCKKGDGCEFLHEYDMSKCQSVTFTPDLMLAITRSVHFYTSILRAKLETVHGMTEVFVGMVLRADIDMSDVSFVSTIWPDFVRKVRNVRTPIQNSNYPQ